MFLIKNLYCLTVVVMLPLAAHAEVDYLSHNLDVAQLIPNPNYWSNNFINSVNSSLGLDSTSGCEFCGEIFYQEPPPDDIIFIPSPPIHPSFQNALNEDNTDTGKRDEGQCRFCNLFYSETEQLSNMNEFNRGFTGGYIIALGSIVALTLAMLLYLAGVRKPRIIPSLARTTLFKSQPASTGHPSHQNHLNKSGPLGGTLPHPGLNMTDPCYLQTDRDKTRSSPMISDQVPHKKTAIPSKCWAQPSSIVNRTVRRVPNEYEVPSSHTNSTGASSAVYADMGYDHHNNHNNNARFFSPYNLHTYAEVREVMDPNEHFHTSSNSSAMLSESNYDNALYPHKAGTALQNISNGTVQMSDFNSMRPSQSITHQQVQMGHQTLNQGHHNQPIYEQPQQRAQVMITTNNQGVNPVILNHRDRIHNVI